MKMPTYCDLMPTSHRKWIVRAWLLLIVGVTVVTSFNDCPWGVTNSHPVSPIIIPQEIISQCICSNEESSRNSKLSIQCHEINAHQLVSILLDFNLGQTAPIELIYLNSSRIANKDGILAANTFRGIKILNLQLSSCDIHDVHHNAFAGTENFLRHLSFSNNEFQTVPSKGLQKLHNLMLLDLSKNKITHVQANAFKGLHSLATLKLNDNPVELLPGSLNGLELTLRNLNLKGSRMSVIPEAVSNLSALNFLDLAQNRLRELSEGQFSGMAALTALNLERNLLQTLPPHVFEGVNNTLSSLSLLNNLITKFPRPALENLKELRVLDLGFNLLTEVPDDAFNGMTSLTLLALDGNPLTTISEVPFTAINNSLRGISIGSRFLNCDCHLRWILRWLHDYDLQITSREKNPKFCGSPKILRRANFVKLSEQDLTCESEDTTTTESPKKFGKEPFLDVIPAPKLNPNSTKNINSSSDEELSEENTTQKSTAIYKLDVPKIFMNSTGRTPWRPRLKNTSNRRRIIFKEDERIDSNHQKNKTEDTATEKISVQVNYTSSETTTASISSTTESKVTVRNPPIRPNIQPKLNTKPPTFPEISGESLSLTSTTAKTLTTPSPSSEKPYQISNMLKPQKTATHNQQLPKQLNPLSSKTIKAVHIDESKIPVISGVGSAISAPNFNTGSVMTVKQPKPMNFPARTTTQRPYEVTTARSVPPNLLFAERSEIFLKEVSRGPDFVDLKWKSLRQLAGFRIVYRFFGEDTFRHGPPLASTETEYRVKQLPPNECIVICVVPYEDILYNEISTSAASLPPGSQCRELKPDSHSTLMYHMDKITIGASAAICLTVAVAVIIFIGITQRSKSKRPTSTLLQKIPPTSYVTPSPGPNKNSTYGISKEWDQMSVVSTKSIPRARVFHGSMDGLAMNTNHRTPTLTPHMPRHVVESVTTHRGHGGTHHHHHNHGHGNHTHTYSLSHNGNGHASLQTYNQGNSGASAVSNYLNNQSRLLRTSLGSRASQDALNKLASIRHSHHQIDQFRRKRMINQLRQSESLNTLNGYETPDNWTDHDVDFYVARNHTRHDLVQL